MDDEIHLEELFIAAKMDNLRNRKTAIYVIEKYFKLVYPNGEIDSTALITSLENTNCFNGVHYWYYLFKFLHAIATTNRFSILVMRRYDLQLQNLLNAGCKLNIASFYETEMITFIKNNVDDLTLNDHIEMSKRIAESRLKEITKS